MRKNVIKVINFKSKARKKLFKIVAIITLIYFLFFTVFTIMRREEKVLWLRNCYFAHRGLFNNDDLPENSIKAFKNAIKNGFAIELDVQFTKDKKVIVFHDYTLERLTKDLRKVEDVTYEELESLNLLNSKEKIPLLEEVLNIVNGDVPLLIEIKNCSNILELGASVADLLENYNGKYAIQSFDTCVLKWFKENKGCNVLTGQLIGKYTGIETFRHCENLVLDFKKFFLEYKVDFLSIDSYDLDNLAIKIFRILIVPILSWTIRNNDELENIKDLADGYIFDSFVPVNN